MSVAIARVSTAMAATLAGMLAGWSVGGALGFPLLGVTVGGAAASAAWALRDAWQAQRVLAWLRGDMVGGAPRGRGIWGELGYRAERAIRGRESQATMERTRLAQFLSGIDASPNGVMLLDADARIDWCNSTAATHFGLDPLRDRQQHATNLIRHPEFVALLQRRRFDQAIQVPGAGANTTLSILARPYGEGACLVLSQDITERERADAMRRDFVANVSHEIRTPLTVLAGFVESLTQLPLDQAERARVFELMEAQTRRMQALVSDLLILAQLEGSPPPGAERWVALGPLVRRTLDEARTLSSGRQVIELAAEPVTEVAGAETELHSAITNLLTNAVRYTPRGGHVTVRWIWRADGSAALEVADDGIGIAPEHLPRLTERFYRVDGSRSRDTGGTGLGLAIVKHVMQRHGGEVTVESKPGEGSRFGLVFPAVRVRRGSTVSA